ncbi:MAG: hypothetical protein GY801_08985 [bacterium]|nr:hypothetical protein [bacterium]
MSKKFLGIASLTVFIVTFNLGYVFHDLLLGKWFHQQEAEIAREHFIIPLLAVAFMVYAILISYLFPIYRKYYANSNVMWIGIRFGLIMGVLWDALQGGIIEVATFKIPFIVFAVDTSYHVFVEGAIAGLLLAFIYKKVEPVTA